MVVTKQMKNPVGDHEGYLVVDAASQGSRLASHVIRSDYDVTYQQRRTIGLGVRDISGPQCLNRKRQNIGWAGLTKRSGIPRSHLFIIDEGDRNLCFGWETFRRKHRLGEPA